MILLSSNLDHLKHSDSVLLCQRSFFSVKQNGAIGQCNSYRKWRPFSVGNGKSWRQTGSCGLYSILVSTKLPICESFSKRRLEFLRMFLRAWLGFKSNYWSLIDWQNKFATHQLVWNVITCYEWMKTRNWNCSRYNQFLRHIYSARLYLHVVLNSTSPMTQQ